MFLKTICSLSLSLSVQNLVFGISLFVFNAFTTFSGQYMYSDVYMTLFNVIFTALTPIIIGIFDRDVDREKGLQYPALYKQGEPDGQKKSLHHLFETVLMLSELPSPASFWNVLRPSDSHSGLTSFVTALTPPPSSRDPPPTPGQHNTYFNFWSIAGWLGTAIMQNAIIMILVLIGCRPTIIDRAAGNVYGSYEVCTPLPRGQRAMFMAPMRYECSPLPRRCFCGDRA